MKITKTIFIEDSTKHNSLIWNVFLDYLIESGLEQGLINHSLEIVNTQYGKVEKNK